MNPLSNNVSLVSQLLGCLLILLLSTAKVSAMSMCPAGFVEIEKTSMHRVCNYQTMLTSSFTGSPSQSPEGRQLITDAAIECRRVGRFVDGGDVGADSVFVRCEVDLSEEEVEELEDQQQQAEEQARMQHEEEEARRQEEQEAARQQQEEEARRQQEEEEARRRQEEEQARRREQDEETRRLEQERERRLAQERRLAELERLEQEARNAPFVFDQPSEVQALPAESSIASGLVSVCTGLRNSASLSPAQADLLERCIDLNREREGAVQLNALGQIAARQYSDIGQSIAFLNTIQVGNIGGRLAAILPALRQNDKDVSWNSTSHPDKGLLADSKPTGNVYGGAAGDEGPGRFGAFILGTGGDGDKDASTLSNGFDYLSRSMTFGVDYLVNPSTIAGIAFGYGSTEADFSGNTGSLDIQSKTLVVYAAKAFSNDWNLDAIAGFGDGDLESVRRMAFTAFGTEVDQRALSDIDSDQKILSVGVSRSFGNLVNFDVSARLNYVDTDIKRFAEDTNTDQLGFGLALEIDNYNLESFTSDVSLGLSKAFSLNWGVLIPQARASWVHEFEDGSRELTGRFLADTSSIDFRQSGLSVSGIGSTIFSVPLERLDSNYGNFLLGANFLFPNQISMNASFNKTLGLSGFDHNYYSLSVRKDF